MYELYKLYRGTYGNKRIRIWGRGIKQYKEDMRGIEGIWLREKIEWNKVDSDAVRGYVIDIMCICVLYICIY